jgi:hypothetical protein
MPLVRLPVEGGTAEAGAINCEQILEAWQAIEQALIHLDHLPRREAWQVLLAPFGLQVVAPPSPAESAPGGAP